MKNINIRRQGNNVDEFNTGIHRDYVNDWGLWEAIREIVQNFKDAIIVDNGKDDNITWTPDDDYLNWKIESANSVELGAIEYSTESQTLKFINNGTISTRCLLLGGSLKSGDVLAGRYGEGLKLAALVFLRTQKSFKVHTGKNLWNFYFKSHEFFENQEVLHFSISDRSYEEDRSKTVAVISGISKDEWILSRNKFTFLSPVLYDINNTKIYVLPSNVGEDYLIDNNKWKGWLFDRGIFVQKKSNITLGAFDLKLRLDRNRNVVIDDSNLKEQISKGILWVLQALKLKNQQEYQVFLNRIYTLLAKNSFEVEKIQNYITTPTANDLFELFLNLHGITAQPCTEYQNDEIEEAKKLGVAMVGVKSQLMGCLIKSHLYKPITSITHAATQVKPDYTPTRGEMNVVERVADLVPDMTLKFKCGLSVDTSLQKRTLYISSNLLNQDHVHKEKKGLCLHIIEGKCMCREINLIWRIAMRLKLGEDKITSKILSLR